MIAEPYIIDSGPSPRGWSYYSTFLRCPMLFFWRYVHNGGAGSNYSTPYLARGTIFHVGRAHNDARQWAVENGHDPERVIEPVTAMRICAERLGEDGASKIVVAEQMYHSYRQRYERESFTIVGVERLGEVTFGGARYTARLDRIVRERYDLRVWIHDTKTTVRVDGGTARKYAIHGQFFGHTYIGRSLYGDEFGGVVVDMAGEDLNFLRRPTEPAPFAFRMFPALIERTHDRIEKAREMFADDPAGWMTLASPDEQVCFGKYGQCSMLERCRWGG